MKNHLLLLENENFTCLAKMLQLLRTSVRSTTEFNVIIGIYYDPFLIVIANKVGYVCFFLTVITFGIDSFEFEFPFYTAGMNIPSNINAYWDGFFLISFILLIYVFFHSCANWCKVVKFVFVKGRGTLVDQTLYTLQNLYHSDETSVNGREKKWMLVV